MPSPIPPKPRGGVAILNLVDDSKDRRKQAVGILEGRLKYVEAICADVARAASFADDDAITKIKGLYRGVPPPVNSTGSVGGSRLASPGDHTHRGVTSLFKTSEVAGPVIFTGAGVTQAGATFNFPGATAPVFGTPVDVGRANAAGASTEFVRKDHVHRGLDYLFVNTTQTGNGAGVETDLFSVSIAGATLAADGDTIDFFGAGTFGAVASIDKRLRVKFGGTTIFDSGALAVTSLQWRLEGQIIRTGAATQKVVCQILTSGTTTLFSPVSFTSPTETLSGAVTLKVTGAGTNASDVVGELFAGLWLPSP